MGGGRRSDRRAQPEKRLDSRARLLTDVQPGRLQRARDHSQARRSGAHVKDGDFAANYPSLDRAVDGTYPPGSTFKPLTAIAALEEHLINPYEFYPCTGTYVAPQDSSNHVWHNWDRFVNEGMDLPTAIAQSCDTYFYGVGDKFYALPRGRGQPIQKWARRFGFDQKSGSDLGPQSPGLVPTIAWKQADVHEEQRPELAVDRLWKPGDSLNLSIGQGNLTVTPLQMARFYAAIANGGKLVTPHILEDVENPNGTPVPTKAPAAPRPVKGLNPADLSPSSKASSRPRTTLSAPRTASSAISPSRSPARPGRRRRPSVSRASQASKTSRGGAAMVRERREARRLRRDRERRRRRRGRCAGGRAGLREVLQRAGDPDRTHPLRLMNR